MSLLRKKLDLEPRLPDHIKNGVGVWRNLHLSLCDMFSSLTQTAWEPSNVDVTYGDLKALRADLAPRGLSFGYGNVEGVCGLLIHFDGAFSARITSKSLGTDNTGADETYEPSLLDLLLLKPMSDTCEEELNNLFSSGFGARKTRLRQIGQGLSPQMLEMPRGISIWNEITLLIKKMPPKGEIQPDSTDYAAIEAGEDADPEVAPPRPIGSLAIKILIPQTILQNLLATSAANNNARNDDDNGPWADHMYRSMVTASVPIRAVIESFHMTVADCTRLKIGQVIDLPGVSLQSIGLETDMPDKQVNIGTAALGIYKSRRAVKLTSDLDPDFFTGSISLNGTSV